MEYELMIESGEVIDDLRSAGWLESELHPELNRHRRHQMADICERGNIECVWRTAGVAIAQVRQTLAKILKDEDGGPYVNEINRVDAWHFQFRQPMTAATMEYMKEKIHEYVVAMVMGERVEIIIPESAGIWRQRAEEALAMLRNVANMCHLPCRRPMWPL